MGSCRCSPKLKFMKKILLVCFCILSFIADAIAQDDLLKMLDQEKPKDKEPVTGTFKTTRIVNLHSVETLGKRTLDFRINHRFGTLNGGGYNFWGLDQGASIRLGLEYSYDGKLMFGLGRTSVDKTFDGFVKYKILSQTADNSMPLSLAWVSSANLITVKNPDRFKKGTDRLVYMHQLIIARKFNEQFSFQVMPTLIHYNIVEKQKDKNDIYALGFAGRYRISKSVALTGEYAYRLNKYTDRFNKYYNSFAVGIDIETGGHVFQIQLVNSLGVNETQLIPYTDTRWLNGGFRLGFNISRVFSL